MNIFNNVITFLAPVIVMLLLYLADVLTNVLTIGSAPKRFVMPELPRHLGVGRSAPRHQGGFWLGKEPCDPSSIARRWRKANFWGSKCCGTRPHVVLDPQQCNDCQGRRWQPDAVFFFVQACGSQIYIVQQCSTKIRDTELNGGLKYVARWCNIEYTEIPQPDIYDLCTISDSTR